MRIALDTNRLTDLFHGDAELAGRFTTIQKNILPSKSLIPNKNQSASNMKPTSSPAKFSPRAVRSAPAFQRKYMCHYPGDLDAPARL